MTAAEWYPDPTGRHRLRYWDGAAWTDHVADGYQSRDPVAWPPPGPETGAGLASSSLWFQTGHGGTWCVVDAAGGLAGWVEGALGPTLRTHRARLLDANRSVVAQVPQRWAMGSSVTVGEQVVAEVGMLTGMTLGYAISIDGTPRLTVPYSSNTPSGALTTVTDPAGTPVATLRGMGNRAGGTDYHLVRLATLPPAHDLGLLAVPITVEMDFDMVRRATRPDWTS